MSTGDRHDPLLSFNFRVEIDSIHMAAFSEVSGLQAEIEVNEYREGGVNEYIHKRLGPVKYPSNLILKKGVTDSTDLWKWYRDTMNGHISRKSLDILLMDSSGTEARRWKFLGAYPVKWSGPELKGAGSEVAVETLELAHKGLGPQ
jgi:phage tail-like protein